MNRFVRFCAVAAAACGSFCSAAQPGESRPPARMLWVGSSSLYYHNQPKVCAEWLGAFGGMPAVAEIAGRSGTGVHVYLRPGFQAEYGLKRGQSILEKIAEGKYQYVVVQIPAEFIHGPEGEEFDRALDVYCRAIRAAGGEPVFYEMGWGRGDGTEVGRRKTFAAAVRNRVTLFAPCSTAWSRVRRERPDLELQNPPDTAHPGTLGTYLNQCCFFAALTGKPPAELPREIPIWRRPDADRKALLDAKLNATPFDAYDAALPDWMKRQMLNGRVERLSGEVAQYLRGVAWEEHQSIQSRLKQAMAEQQ